MSKLQIEVPLKRESLILWRDSRSSLETQGLFVFPTNLDLLGPVYHTNHLDNVMLIENFRNVLIISLIFWVNSKNFDSLNIICLVLLDLIGLVESRYVDSWTRLVDSRLVKMFSRFMFVLVCEIKCLVDSWSYWFRWLGVVILNLENEEHFCSI